MLLVCGEALMDVFAVGETATGVTLDARIGGSPFNVAVGLARMGQPVGFFGAVSRGFLGERLMAALHAEGVTTGATLRTDAPTTLSLVGTDAHGMPSYAFYGTGAADRQLLPDALSQVPAGIQALHLGSYTAVVAPAAGTLRQLIERVHLHTRRHSRVAEFRLRSSRAPLKRVGLPGSRSLQVRGRAAATIEREPGGGCPDKG